jgi:tyrosyl-tRNA synthetase
MMSPYAFYQFWLNVDDREVVDMLKTFTFFSRDEIEELGRQTEEKPFLRAGQKALAEHVTTLVHGAEETAQVQAAASALFGGADLAGLTGGTLAAALREAGATSVSGEIPSYVDLLVETGLAKSRGDARRTIAEGGAYLNNQRVEDPDMVPSRSDLVAGSWLVLRRGKKTFAGVEVAPI